MIIRDDQRELDQYISGNLTPEQHCYEYLSKTNIPGQKRIKGQEALWLRYIINEFFYLFLITFSIQGPVIFFLISLLSRLPPDLWKGGEYTWSI